MINKFFPFVLLCSMFSLLGTFQEEILVNLISQSSKVLTDFEGVKRLETQQVERALSKLESQKYFPEDALTYDTFEFINRPTNVGIKTAKEEAPMNTINGAFLLPKYDKSSSNQLLQYMLDVERFEPMRDRTNPSILVVDRVIDISQHKDAIHLSNGQGGERDNK